MELELKINNEVEMIDLGYKLGKLLEANMVISLNGNLGAGKTTLTKGIGKALNVKTVINSPTYTILKIHEGDLKLYHMDVYRINEDSGDDYLEEYFEMGGITVVEWSENISYLLPKDILKIDIFDLGETSRQVRLTSSGEKYNKMIESVKMK